MKKIKKFSAILLSAVLVLTGSFSSICYAETVEGEGQGMNISEITEGSDVESNQTANSDKAANESGIENVSFRMTTSPNCKMGEYTTNLKLEKEGDKYYLIVPDYGIYYSLPKGTAGTPDTMPTFEVALPENTEASLKVSYNQVMTTDGYKEGRTVESDSSGKAQFDTLIYNTLYDDSFSVEIIPEGQTSGKVYPIYIKPQIVISSVTVTDSKKQIRPFENSKTYSNKNTIHPKYKEVTTDAVKGDTVTIFPTSYASQLTNNQTIKPVYTMKVNGEQVALTGNTSTYTYKIPEDGETTIEISASCEGCQDAEPVTLHLLSAEEDNYPQIATFTKQTLTLSINATETISISLNNSNQEGFSYQWEKGTLKGYNQIAAANSAECSIDTSKPAKNEFYRCIVTKTVDGREYTATSKQVASVTVNVADGESVPVPTIKTQPVAAKYEVGQSIKALSVDVEGCVGGTLKYQWYKNSDNSYDGATAITSATKQQYSPTQAEVGTVYYFCEVYDTISSKQSSPIKSDIVGIEVTSVPTFSLEGAGTEEKPYLIKSLSDLNTLREFVNNRGASFANSYFKLEDDITLDKDWVPIGTTKDGTDDVDYGRNMRPFSGIFDGNDKQITVADGGLPLFNYVRAATIKNLKIYGTRIDGYGLINNYNIDYGEDGLYNTGCPETATIDNVTLITGTKILKSGLIGGFASGANKITITNCVAQKGVIIGYDKQQSSIGTFAGSFNGIMINCKSEADVYGISNVGGLIGGKGQSMGSCSALNCEFSGNVYATGEQVGGIIGSGYDGSGTAPNTPVVTIKNCLVSGNITGNDRVGGILGAEPGCEDCWANGAGSVENSIFCGKITATKSDAAVGAIVGFLKSYNEYQTVGDNYYLNDCGAKNGIGQVELIKLENFDITKTAQSVTKEQLTNNSVVKKLNASKTSFKNWIQGENFPEHSKEPLVYALKLDGTPKTEYKVGESFDKSGLSVTGILTDGTEKNISLDDPELKFSGFDNSKASKVTVKVTYGVAESEYEVTVLYAEPKDITVKFTLLGDEKHFDESGKNTTGETHTLASGNLTTWIPETTYTITQNDTVWTVLQKALKDNNMTYDNPSGNYVTSITRNGISLGEFSNGKLSGWMYTLNGTHPLLGVSEQYLNNGDIIVFHYTDDYTKEEGSDKWDIPGTGDDTAVSTTQDITATVKDGEATAAVAADAITKLIDDAVKNTATNINLNVKNADKADKVSVELPKTSVSNIANKTDADLTVTTPLGKVTMDKNAMKEAVKAASGSDLTIVLEKQSIADESKDTLGSSAAQTKVSILSGGKEITDLGTAKLKILLPVSDTLKDKNLAAAAVDADGSLTKIDGKTVTVDGKTYYQIETSKPGSFVVAESESIDAAIKAQAGETDEEKAERIKAGVEKTTIKLRSTFSKKNNIQLKWTKSKGYKVDYYEVFKSTKRFSGFGTKAYYKTSTGTKNTYINTKELKKGTRYFYKVRGVRIINGEKVYTQWSNKAWRISRVNRK